MNPVRICEALVLTGVGAQAWGLYTAFGPEMVAIVIGLQATLLGVLGVLRA